MDSQGALEKEIKTIEKSLGDKLRERREFLGYSQEYVGAKLNMTQSAVSLIENGKTKFTGDLVQKVKEIEKFEDFDEGTPELAENLVARKLPFLTRPWGKTSLYITYSVVGLLLFNLASMFADDASRGLDASGGANVYLVAGLTLFYFVLFGLIIYMLISLIKRVANRKRRGE